MPDLQAYVEAKDDVRARAHVRARTRTSSSSGGEADAFT
jgi:hypothetical protein